MSPTKNLSLTFKAVPKGMPVPGQDLAVTDLNDHDASAPAPSGGLVLETLYASFDPYLRGRMRGPEIKSYMPGFAPGSPVATQCLATVLKVGSAVKDFKAGDTVIGILPVQEFTVLPEVQRGMRVVDLATGPKDIRDYLGALGGPGLTAYASLYEIGKPKKGETIFISSAAGAVGQIVGQLAKHEGLKVFGSAGSDEKCKACVEQLGFDDCFNYKKEGAAEALDRMAPDGLDIYYDNVGGEQLDAALERMRQFGRIVACGMISDYNAQSPQERYGIKNLFNIIGKRVLMQGFLVLDENMMKWAPEHQKNVTKWLNDGSLKAITHEDVGMETAAEACVGVLNGRNFGKAVLKIKV